MCFSQISNRPQRCKYRLITDLILWYVPSEPAVGEGGAADGVVLQALCGPHERRQVPALRQGTAQKLLGHRDVHCPAAAKAVLRLQVHTKHNAPKSTHAHKNPDTHTHTYTYTYYT